MQSTPDVWKDTLARVRLAIADRYQVGDVIGYGGTAVVVRATDLREGREVAIKILRPELVASVGSERFLREILTAAKLQHPHILPLFEHGKIDDLPYYVMPLADGPSLRRRLESEGQLPLEDALRIVRQIGLALVYAHEHGVLHRDVKPENILLSAGAAALCDFGLVKALDGIPQDRLTESGIAVGTVHYMSPEQGLAGPVDGRTDQYSLACVLYEMLTGDPPFRGRTAQAVLARHRLEERPSIRTVRESVSPEVDAVVQRAMARVAADRFPAMDDFIRALDGALTSDTLRAVRQSGALVGVPGHRQWMAWPKGVPQRIALTAAIAAIAATAWYVATRGTDDLPLFTGTLAKTRIVVAPFDVFDPQDTVWRNGYVDILTRTFDGAGPLQAIPATIAIKRFRGRADQPSATDLARETGAGLVVYGQLLKSGADSSRISARLLDASTERVIAEAEVVEARDRPDRMADSLTVRLLRAAGDKLPFTAASVASLGTSSLGSIKAFLQGEQLYRQNDFAAARGYFERAVAQDSAFALPYRRLRWVLRALGGESDPQAFQYARLAGERNHGLAPRDSLLVLSDSLGAGMQASAGFGNVRWIGLLRRRLTTLEEAVRRYPSDAESWYELAEVRHHFGERLGITSGPILDALLKSVEADSTFGPAYSHTIELLLTDRGVSAARRYIRAYRAVNPADTSMLMVEQRLYARPAPYDLTKPSTRLALATAAYTLRRLADSSEHAVSMFRELVDAGYGDERFSETAFRTWLVSTLLYRGHLVEAASRLDASTIQRLPEYFVQMARLGAVSDDSARRVFSGWLRDPDPTRAILALPWWSERRDTTALTRARERFRERARQPNGGWEGYGDQLAGTLLTLVRGDTASALRELSTLPDSLVPSWCNPARMMHAGLLLATGDAAGAAAALDRRPPLVGAVTITEPLWMLERARAAERSGDAARARALRLAVGLLWRKADSSVRSLIAK